MLTHMKSERDDRAGLGSCKPEELQHAQRALCADLRTMGVSEVRGTLFGSLL